MAHAWFAGGAVSAKDTWPVNGATAAPMTPLGLIADPLFHHAINLESGDFAMTMINEPINGQHAPEVRTAHLDEFHVGHISGALGTILQGDIAPRVGVWPKLKSLLAILGPGLIVMVGDNDAGAFGTYTQAG